MNEETPNNDPMYETPEEKSKCHFDNAREASAAEKVAETNSFEKAVDAICLDSGKKHVF